MLLPATQLLKSLAIETRRLAPAEGAELMGSSQKAVAAALRLLQTREAGGAALLQAQFDQLRELLAQTAARLPDAAPARKALTETCSALLRCRAQTEVTALEAALQQRLTEIETLARQLASDRSLDAQTRSMLCQALTRWEVGDLQAQLGSAASGDGTQGDTELSAERMTRYLRERFQDDSLTVPSFRSLPGGFGKQTYLFEVRGAALAGDFVLRRDGSELVISNDCHRIDIEYQLIRAVHARGFPAPEALWVDTEHALLPGGDFLVMRRSPGAPRGDVFSTGGALPTSLSDTLATILARLHALPAMDELAHLNESINAQRATQSLAACVHDYLHSWRDLYLRLPHLPSPAMISQFEWLLDHLPPLPGAPVLLHGDIGFHNFLFHNDELSAVLDWEFGHLGDPAEDLAYVRNTIGDSLDWPAFMAAYRAAGGTEVDERRLHFFQVWGHLRNACAGNLATTRFARGENLDLKLALLPHTHVPMFLQAAQALIDRADY